MKRFVPSCIRPPRLLVTSYVSRNSSPDMFSCSHSTGDQQYDQIAAALLNRYPSLMMEMNNVGQQGGGQARSRAKEDGQASQSPLAGPTHKLPPSAHNKKVERRPPDPVPEKRPTEVTGHPWSTGTLGKPPARDSPRLNTPPGPEALTDSQSSQEKPSAPLQPSTHITSNSLMPSVAPLPAITPTSSAGAPEATPRPLAHSVASQLHPPPDAAALPPSVREDMQAGLKGLFKMQAEFQGKKKPVYLPDGGQTDCHDNDAKGDNDDDKDTICSRSV